MPKTNNVTKEKNFSNSIGCNLSFSNSSMKKNQNSNYRKESKEEKKIFDVIHKKEIISLDKNLNDKNGDSNNFPRIKYKCIYCENNYNNENRLESHMRIHTGEKPFKCSFCVKTFTERGNLIVHLRVHTNDRPYHCPFSNICNQSFKTNSQLSDHLLKHTKIKKFSCPECKASFSRKRRLKIHIMIHKGEKPFQCNICLKKFREKSNYNYHMKKHLSKTEEKEEHKNHHNYYLNNKIRKIFNENDLVMDRGITNFCINDNNSTKSNSNENSIGNNKKDLNLYQAINNFNFNQSETSFINIKNNIKRFNNNLKNDEKDKKDIHKIKELELDNELNISFISKDNFQFNDNRELNIFHNYEGQNKFFNETNNNYDELYFNNTDYCNSVLFMQNNNNEYELK